MLMKGHKEDGEVTKIFIILIMMVLRLNTWGWWSDSGGRAPP
jgi:hypothetical protein